MEGLGRVGTEQVPRLTPSLSGGEWRGSGREQDSVGKTREIGEDPRAEDDRAVRSD